MNDSIFLVGREDYKALVERLKVEKIRTEKIEEREFTILKVFGIDSDDCICARKTYNEGLNKPEEYYILNYLNLTNGATQFQKEKSFWKLKKKFKLSLMLYPN